MQSRQLATVAGIPTATPSQTDDYLSVGDYVELIQRAVMFEELAAEHYSDGITVWDHYVAKAEACREYARQQWDAQHEAPLRSLQRYL